MTEPTETPVEIDPKDVVIAELQAQVAAMEKFANAVIAQRNQAFNQLAQHQI